MIYDELIGEIYWVIGKIQADPKLEEELYRLNFDIRKNGVKVQVIRMFEWSSIKSSVNWNELRTLPKNLISANTCLR